MSGTRTKGGAARKGRAPGRGVLYTAADEGRESRFQAAEIHAMVDATEELAKAMAVAGVTHQRLAIRMGVARATVTRMLQGRQNLTLGTLAKAYAALGYEMEPPRARGLKIPAKLRREWERQGLD